MNEWTNIEHEHRGWEPNWNKNKKQWEKRVISNVKVDYCLSTLLAFVLLFNSWYKAHTSAHAVSETNTFFAIGLFLLSNKGSSDLFALKHSKRELYVVQLSIYTALSLPCYKLIFFSSSSYLSLFTARFRFSPTLATESTRIPGTQHIHSTQSANFKCVSY